MSQQVNNKENNRRDDQQRDKNANETADKLSLCRR